MKGLKHFIQEIKACKSPKEEEARVDHELSKIRATFDNPKKLDGYSRKKYMYKLVMIYLLGHKIAAIGFSEALNLVASTKLREKLAGYLYFSIVMLNSADLSSSVIDCMRGDIGGRNELTCALALNCIGIVAGRNIMSQFQPPIANFVLLSEVSPMIKKKAVLCLLKFYRLSPEAFPHKLLGNALVSFLESSPDLGLVTCVTSLLIAVVQASPADYPNVAEAAVNRLHKVMTVQLESGYTFHLVPAPWLTINLMRLIASVPASSDPTTQALLQVALAQICERATRPPPERVRDIVFRGKLSYYHCNYACLFEVASLIATHDNLSQSGMKFKSAVASQLVPMLVANGPTTKWGVLNALLSLGQTRLGTDILEPHRVTLRECQKMETNATVLQVFKEVLDILDEVCEPPSASLAAMSMGGGAGGGAGAIPDEGADEDGFFASETSLPRHDSSDED